MTKHWEPGVQYNNGDTVEYHGKRYNIIQPHRSQGDWTPDRTPALWGLVPYYDCDDDYKEKHKHEAHKEEHQARPPSQWNPPKPSGGYGQPQQPQQPGGGYGQPQQPQQPGGGYGQPQQPQQPQQPAGGGYGQPPPPVQVPHQTVKVDEEEQKKSWYDLSDDRKKQLAVGGGIAAGIGLLGAGVAAYKHHEKEEEEQKAIAWAAQGWLTEAQRCTQQYYQNGPQGPLTWVLVHGTEIPKGAIPCGSEGNQSVYISRTFHEGGIQVGKASISYKKGCIIPFFEKEYNYDTYEILVGDSRGIRWVDVSGKLDINNLGGARPVEGGKENDGTPLYIAQVDFKNRTLPGKINPKYKGAYFAADGEEKNSEKYKVLTYA